MPLAAGEQVRGALMLGRLAVRQGFTGADLNMAASFASHAAVAMELVQARADQITLARAEDHDRIAGDLHDHVIQELFALGMRLQSDAARSDPATTERVNGYVDTLDEIIKKIRTSIFGLQQPRQPPASLHPRLIEIIEEHAPQLGFTASIRLAGPPDPDPDEALAHDILAVTREALSNCARHARATAVSISLALQDRQITLDITDNGRGLGTPARSSGLASMRRRAENNSGTLQLTTPARRHPAELDGPPARVAALRSGKDLSTSPERSHHGPVLNRGAAAQARTRAPARRHSAIPNAPGAPSDRAVLRQFMIADVNFATSA